MSQPGLKLSINLNRGVSSTFENKKAVDDGEKFTDQFADEKDDVRPASNESAHSRKSGASDAPSPSSKAALAESSDLLNVNIPTASKAFRKRKHIKTNFDEELLLDSSSLTAQRKEQERLERLKQKQADNNDHVAQMAAFMEQQRASQQVDLNPLPVLDINEVEEITDDKSWQRHMDFNDVAYNTTIDCGGYPGPSTSSSNSAKYEPEIIDLSSDDENDVVEVGAYLRRRIAPPSTNFIAGSVTPPRRMRWCMSDKERLARIQMEDQQRIEEERLRRRGVKDDSEQLRMDTKAGQLIVNQGHPPEDPDVAVASHLTQVLQPHQLGGVRFMYDNVIESVEEYKNSPGFGCILAHSMGLGKTLQVVTFTDVFFRATKAGKVLIIVPINTIQNWFNEFEKWIPARTQTGERFRQFDVHILGDSVKSFDQRVNLIETWHNSGGVLLIGYDMFRLLINSTQPKKKGRPKLNFINGKKIDREEEQDMFDQGLTHGGRVKKEANALIREALLSPGPDLCVCDEGHKIKNLNTDIALALGSIKTTRRIVLTGYPLQNNLMEYFCMVDFVRPKYLGEKKAFATMFEKPIKNGQCVDSTIADVKLARQRTHVLIEKLKGFVQRRTHNLLKSILPESKEFVLLLRKSPLQHMLYRNFLLYANGEIRAGSSVFNPLKAFAACSKIWNHPDVLSKTLTLKQRQRQEADAKKSNSAANLAVPGPSSQTMCTPPGSFGAPPMNYNGFGGMSCLPNGMPMYPQQMPTSSGYPMSNTSGFPMNNCSGFPMNNSSGYPMHQNQMPHVSNSAPNLGDLMGNMMNGNNNVATHGNIWNGVFGQGGNDSFDLDLGDVDDDSCGAPSTKKKGRPKKNLVSAMMEEMEMEDSGLKYDWAEIAMAHYQTGNIEHGYKMKLALEIIDETTRRGEKILLFSQNLTALDLFEEYLDRRSMILPNGAEQHWLKNRSYFRLDGSTNGSDREKLINKFNSNPEVMLFLISTRAGSLGINLVSANRCIILDACWNPCHDAQAVCRVYRYGQQKKTYIYRLVMDNSMERAIFNRQVSKHGMQQRVVDEATVDVNVTTRELETLLLYDESEDVIIGSGEWDMSDWDYDDPVLMEVLRRNNRMLANKPFLHESLILEREEGLSEQEKNEARLLFERERLGELTGPTFDPFDRNQANPFAGVTRDYRTNQAWTNPQTNEPNVLPPPLRSTPLAQQLQFNSNYRGNGGLTMAGGSYGINNGSNYDGPSKPIRIGGRPNLHQFSDGQVSDPNTKIPGASFAGIRIANASGSLQKIVLDSDMHLPVLSMPDIIQSIAAGTECTLVQAGNGLFLRLLNGVLLDAAGTIFTQIPNPAIASQFVPPQIPRLVSRNLGQQPEIIDLD